MEHKSLLELVQSKCCSFPFFHGSQQSTHFFRIELCSHKTKTRYEYSIRSLWRQSEVIAFHEAGGVRGNKAKKQYCNSTMTITPSQMPFNVTLRENILKVHNIKLFFMLLSKFFITTTAG